MVYVYRTTCQKWPQNGVDSPQPPSAHDVQAPDGGTHQEYMFVLRGYQPDSVIVIATLRPGRK